MKRHCIGWAAVFISALCHAQPVYKVVGPDGKVTYTDRPPVQSSSTVTPLNKPAPPPGPSQNDIRDNAVRASLTLYYKQIIVEQARRLCINLAAEYPPVPGAQDALTGVRHATQAWNERHARLLEKKNVVLHDLLTPGELDKVADDARRENEPIRMKLERAPAAERLTWCQRMPATLAAPEFDVAGDPALADAILGHKPKR